MTDGGRRRDYLTGRFSKNISFTGEKKKILKVIHCNSPSDFDLARGEVDILSRFTKTAKSRVVQLYRYHIVQGNCNRTVNPDGSESHLDPQSDPGSPCAFFLLMEYAKGGSLRSFLCRESMRQKAQNPSKSSKFRLSLRQL